MDNIYEHYFKQFKNFFKNGRMQPAFKKNKRSFKDYENFDYNSFKKFDEDYRIENKNKKYIGSSSFSERFFTCFLSKLCIDENIEINGIYRDKGNTNVPIELCSKKLTITKNFDIKIVKNNGSEILIEVKKNIDMVEKDIFKSMLLKLDENKKDRYKIIILIWEEFNKSMGKENNKGHYWKLLEFAKHKEWIDHFTYLYPEENRYKKERKELVNFISKV